MRRKHFRPLTLFSRIVHVLFILSWSGPNDAFRRRQFNQYSESFVDQNLTFNIFQLQGGRLGTPLLQRIYRAFNRLLLSSHISWPSLQLNSCFPDISHPTPFQNLLFSGCVFHRKKPSSASGDFRVNQIFIFSESGRSLCSAAAFSIEKTFFGPIQKNPRSVHVQVS